MTRRPGKALRNVKEKLSDLNALRLLKKVICNSNYVKSNLIVNGISEESIFVNHLFPISHAGAEITGGISQDAVPTILFVGRLFKEKGVDHLLKALALLKGPFRSEIVGEGWERDNLTLLAASLGLENKVVFKGFLSRSEVADLYRKAYLLVVPSLWPEPFGLIGLEAFSYQLPVVAYGSGGIPEWLDNGQNGLIVERGNIRALANKIDTLLGNSSLALRLGENARKQVIERFSFERHLVNLVAVYEKLYQDWSK